MRGGFKNKSGFKRKTGLTKRSGFKYKNGFSPTPDKAKAQRNGFKQKKRKEERQKDPVKWEIYKCDLSFSKLVRLSAADQKGTCTCFTCGRRGFWKRDGIQCGHYKSRSHLKTRWMMDNAKPQCKHCNETLGGNLEIYRRKLIDTSGEDFVQFLDQESRKVVKAELGLLRRLRKGMDEKIKQIRQEKGL